jgi:hypothetical protein
MKKFQFISVYSMSSRTRRNKVPVHEQIKQNVMSRKLAAIQNHHRTERQNRMDRRKYINRSRKNLAGYQRDLENYKALVSAGWDTSRIYKNKENRPREPKLYERSVIEEHPRVSPIKLGKRLGIKIG